MEGLGWLLVLGAALLLGESPPALAAPLGERGRPGGAGSPASGTPCLGRVRSPRLSPLS